MDSKIVNAGIKARIWPELRKNGFDTFSPRTAWRHHADRIDVLNFQSFNSYNASVIGCTTFSFAVNLGCYLFAIPPHFEPSRTKQKKGVLIPQEHECHLRGQLVPKLSQPKLLANNVWFIDETGKNLDSSLQDALDVVQREAFHWFQRFEVPTEILRIFRNDPEHMTHLWGFGRNPSPLRHYFSGYMALSLNDHATAKSHLEHALSSKSFSTVRDRLIDDVARLAHS